MYLETKYIAANWTTYDFEQYKYVYDLEKCIVRDDEILSLHYKPYIFKHVQARTNDNELKLKNETFSSDFKLDSEMKLLVFLNLITYRFILTACTSKLLLRVYI